VHESAPPTEHDSSREQRAEASLLKIESKFLKTCDCHADCLREETVTRVLEALAANAQDANVVAADPDIVAAQEAVHGLGRLTLLASPVPDAAAAERRYAERAPATRKLTIIRFWL
jgi:hypothetical protein